MRHFLHVAEEQISIHAPPRGATGLTWQTCRIRKISIHAPPRGATANKRAGIQRINFNSRPSARGDYLVYCRTTFVRISIHAPPRGATTYSGASCALLDISIHAPPRGATPADSKSSCPYVFQFTPLREGRQCCLVRLLVWEYFNSRPSARGDGKRYAISANLLFNPYKSAWLNNSATQFVEIILVIFHRIIA